jgi:hypothetical protein
MDDYRRAVYALLQAEDPVLLVVGPACRTWYVDRDLVRDVMADLFLVRPYQVVHAGKFPFDQVVEEVAEQLGAPATLVGPDKDKRLTATYERDPYLAVGVSLVVAFPVEDADGKRRYPPESADLGVIRQAVCQGIPIITVHRDGTIRWV